MLVCLAKPQMASEDPFSCITLLEQRDALKATSAQQLVLQQWALFPTGVLEKFSNVNWAAIQMGSTDFILCFHLLWFVCLQGIALFVILNSYRAHERQ